MNGRMYKIKVKDLSKLEEYGFVKSKCEYDWLGTYQWIYYSGRTNKFGNLIYSLKVYDGGNKPNELQIDTCGSGAIKVVCELYRDGVIEFVDWNNVDKRIQRKKTQIEKLKKEIQALEGK